MESAARPRSAPPAPGAGEPVVRVRGLAVRYGERVGLDGVDLDVPAGALFGFLGPNGAGKTTALRVLLGFLRASAGTATVFGLDCWRASPRIKREVGYLPGDLRLYPWMNAERALRAADRVRGASTTAPGLALCERLGLDPRLRVPAMSRGTRQKLGLVLALAHDPRLLVLDEPTEGLDPLVRAELSACLRERAAAGRTVVFSSHTLSEVEGLCDRVAVVRAGRLVADETLEVLRRRARRAVTIELEDADSAARLAPPALLKRVERRGAVWRAELVGPSRELVRWAAGHGVRDLTVAPPDLDSVFRAFYRDGDGA